MPTTDHTDVEPAPPAQLADDLVDMVGQQDPETLHHLVAWADRLAEHREQQSLKAAQVDNS